MTDLANSILSSLQKELEEPIVGHYIIELGVFTGQSYRRDEDKNLKFEGLNNAELMFIHENGAPTRNIPDRPVLDMTLKWAKDNIIPETLNRCYENLHKGNWTKDDIERELKIMCQRIQQYARDIIYINDGRLKANKPATIERKGENHPLFDTGQLARSIRCRLIKL